jgi:hypothetical protein
MQRSLLSLLFLMVLFTSCKHVLEAVKVEGVAISPYIDPFAFIIAVFMVAMCTWIMRSFVESDPDPLCLNLTFFAFAGQWIRTNEIIDNGNLSRPIFFLLVIGFLIVLFQVIVLKAHMRTTREHYEDVLMNYKTDECSDHEIEHWAAALLRITGTDFSPGSYKLLAVLFDSEPRRKSRKQAFSILPSTHFRLASPDGLTADSLTVPLKQRKMLWRCYLGSCLVSWVIFIMAMIISHRI